MCIACKAAHAVPLGLRPPAGCACCCWSLLVAFTAAAGTATDRRVCLPQSRQPSSPSPGSHGGLGRACGLGGWPGRLARRRRCRRSCRLWCSSSCKKATSRAKEMGSAAAAVLLAQLDAWPSAPLLFKVRCELCPPMPAGCCAGLPTAIQPTHARASLCLPGCAGAGAHTGGSCQMSSGNPQQWHVHSHLGRDTGVQRALACGKSSAEDHCRVGTGPVATAMLTSCLLDCLPSTHDCMRA